jgi:DNA polymerase-3 subunit epsilon
VSRDTKSESRGVPLRPRSRGWAPDADLASALAGALQLEGPLAFLDLEATGLDVGTARIVEVSVVRLGPAGETDVFDTVVNPGGPIPAEVSAIHGITDADARTAPSFAAVAAPLLEFLAGADLAGYNIGRYDLPLMAAEFERAGHRFDWSTRRLVDASVIFRRKEPRSLSGAMRFYCDREIESAHAAAHDVAATMEVLRGQLQRYPDLPRGLAELDEFTRPREARNRPAPGDAES